MLIISNSTGALFDKSNFARANLFSQLNMQIKTSIKPWETYYLIDSTDICQVNVSRVSRP